MFISAVSQPLPHRSPCFASSPQELAENLNRIQAEVLEIKRTFLCEVSGPVHTQPLIWIGYPHGGML